MRADKLTISMRTIVDAVAGTVYGMSPFNLPRNMDKIMTHVVESTLD